MRRAIFVALGCLALVACGRRQSGRAEILVAAAASLRNAMPVIAATYQREHPVVHVTVTYGASGDLRQEVIAGAPVDVVVFAGAAPADELIDKGLLDRNSRRVIATNTLVLVGPPGAARRTFATLAAGLGDEKIAVGNPKSVPVGQYAEVALRKLGAWDALSGHLVYGADVTAVLAYARRGEVAAAVVYATDLYGLSDVQRMDDLAPDPSSRPEVVVGLVSATQSKETAEDFLTYLEGEGARKVLTGYGFGPP